LTPKFTQYNMSSSPLLQGSEKIDKNSAPNNLIFPYRTELNTKELGLQALIDISHSLLLSTKKCWGGLREASLIIVIFAFFNIL
jgi:hypothetical protein